MKKIFLFKTIKSKIIALTTISILLLSIITGILQIYTLKKNASYHLTYLENTIKQDFDNNAKNQVENIVSLLDKIYKDYENGNYSLDEAKKIGADLVREIRYGETGYFWIDTKEGVNVVNLGRDSEGISRIDAIDKKGNAFIKNIISKGISGGGFTDYYFPRKDNGKPIPKRSYSLLFEPFGWVIGTGNYMDDINNEINKQAEINTLKLKTSVFYMIIINFIVLIVIAIVSGFIGEQMTKLISIAVKTLKKMSKKQINFQLDNNRNDEIGKLYNSIN
ncbi:MAG: cache domain-containing protein, partial [Bacteroidota bacterium]|nr:cache domain-containing protein [Bacteroidota bacterium]